MSECIGEGCTHESHAAMPTGADDFLAAFDAAAKTPPEKAAESEEYIRPKRKVVVSREIMNQLAEDPMRFAWTDDKGEVHPIKMEDLYDMDNIDWMKKRYVGVVSDKAERYRMDLQFTMNELHEGAIKHDQRREEKARRWRANRHIRAVQQRNRTARSKKHSKMAKASRKANRRK